MNNVTPFPGQEKTPDILSEYLNNLQAIWVQDVPVPVKLIALAIYAHVTPGRTFCWPSRQRLARMCRMPQRTFARHYPIARDLFIHEPRQGRTNIFRVKVADVAAEIAELWPDKNTTPYDGNATGSAILAEGGSANLAEGTLCQFGRGGSANLAEGGSANLAEGGVPIWQTKESNEELNEELNEEWPAPPCSPARSALGQEAGLRTREGSSTKAAHSNIRIDEYVNGTSQSELSGSRSKNGICVDGSQNELNSTEPDGTYAEHMDKRVQDEAFEYLKKSMTAARLSNVPLRLDAGRRKALKGRIRDVGGLSEWKAAVDRIMKSDFLTGRTVREGQRPFVLNFNRHVLNEIFFLRIQEGDFDNRGAVTSGEVVFDDDDDDVPITVHKLDGSVVTQMMDSCWAGRELWESWTGAIVPEHELDHHDKRAYEELVNV